MGNEHYVYALLKSDGNTPFYIGKGIGKRWLEHDKKWNQSESHKDLIICEMQTLGIKVPKCKIAEGLTDNQAMDIEKYWIGMLGLHEEGGLLSNRTYGGCGLRDPSGAIRAQISKSLTGRKHSPETIAKRSASNSIAQKGKKRGPHSAAHKKMMSAIMKAKDHSIERPLFTRKGATTPESTRAKQRVAAIGRKMSDEARAKMSAAKFGRKDSPDTLEKKRISQLRRWALKRAENG